MYKLTQDALIINKWFRNNEMVVNPDKFQVIFFGNNENVDTFSVDGHTIQVSNTVKLLGVTIDNKLTFASHIKDLCKRANQKKSALLRLRKYLDKDRATHAHMLCNAHILSEFRYCPLTV